MPVHPPLAAAIAGIRADLDAIANDATLRDEAGFARRVAAIDRMELHVIDRIEGLLADADDPGALLTLRARADAVVRALEDADERLFARLRAGIRAGRCRGAELARILRELAGPIPEEGTDAIGYDDLDVLVNGLLARQPLPDESAPLEPEMVAYHKTPARVILQLAARLGPDDVFYDVGSGLGQVPVLVHLLSGAAAAGIEYEPAYCAFARACAADLRLPRVRFIHADARTAAYADGTAFFLYTPFRGRMLRQVLARLRDEARGRRIRVFTYGPCTPDVAREDWLRPAGPPHDDALRLAEFASV